MRKNGGFKVQRGVRDTFFFCTRVWQLTTAKPKNAFIFLFFFLIFLLPELFHEKHAEKSREAQLQSALFSLFSKRPLQLSLSLSQSLRVPSTCRGYHRSSEQREERTENERHSDLLTFWLTSTRQGKKKKTMRRSTCLRTIADFSLVLYSSYSIFFFFQRVDQLPSTESL